MFHKVTLEKDLPRGTLKNKMGIVTTLTFSILFHSKHIYDKREKSEKNLGIFIYDLRFIKNEKRVYSAIIIFGNFCMRFALHTF